MSARSLVRSSAVMAAGTLASRVLGLVRNALLVAALGATASGAVDAFNTANMLPTQLYNLIIGGVLNAILVPQIVRVMRQRNGEELVNRLLTAAFLVIAAVAALLTIAAPLVIALYASGLGRWEPLAVGFAFWCMPQVLFYGLYALWGQVLNARHNFGPYMWAPVLNNIISIAALATYLRMYGSYTSGQDPGIWDAGRMALVGGTTTLGIAAQALILYVPLVRSGFRPRFILGLKGTGLASMSKVAMWALAGTAVVSLGDVATTNLGSRAVAAAESASYAGVIVPSTTMYTNAQIIYMLPQSLVTTSIITALFTRMSEKAAAEDHEGVRDDLSLGLRSIAVFTVLFAAGIATLSAPALQVFIPSISQAEAQAGAAVLSILAVGIISQGIWFTLQRVILAYADTKRLFLADVVVGLIPVLMCVVAYLLVDARYWMAWAAASSATTQTVGWIILIPMLRRHLPDLDGRRVSATYLRLILAALPAVGVGLVVRWGLGPADGSLSGTRAVDGLLTIIMAAALMTATYLAVAAALRVRELDVLIRPLSKILRRLVPLLPAHARRALGLGPTSTPPARDAAPGLPPRPEGPRRTPDERAPLVLPPSFPPAIPPMAATAGTGLDMGSTTMLAAPLPPPPPPVRRSVTAPRPAPRSAPLPPPETPITGTIAPATTHRPAPPKPPQVVTTARPQPISPLRGPGAVRPPRPAPDRAGLRSQSSRYASLPGASVATLNPQAMAPALAARRRRMSEGTPIGSGRYHLLSTMPATLPRIVRHRGYDTILDRDVTVLTLTGATPHRTEVLEAAARAVLVEDSRMQRVHDVESQGPGFIITEPACGESLGSLVESGLSPVQVRAIIGEVAQALEACSRRGLNHLHLSPESVRVRPDGTVQLSGVGIESALLGVDKSDSDPLAADRADARALVELLYYGLTRRWPGKRTGIASAPFVDGAPVPPSTLNEEMVDSDADLDALVARTWGGAEAPLSAAQVARSLSPWDASSLPRPQVDQADPAPVASSLTTSAAAAAAAAGVSQAARGVLSRLRGLSTARVAAPEEEPLVEQGAPDPFSEEPVATLPPSVAPAPLAPAPAPEVLPAAAAEEAPEMPASIPPSSHADVRQPTVAYAEPAGGRVPSPYSFDEELDDGGYASSFSLGSDDARGGDGEEEYDDSEPGMSRTTTVIFALVAVAVVVGIILAVNNLRELAGIAFTDRDLPAAETVPTNTSAAEGGAPQDGSAAPAISGAQSLDPFGGGGPGEHPELIGHAVDGDPATAWSSRFYQQSSLAWKQGIGVAVTLSAPAQVTTIELQGTGGGGRVQVRATSPEDPQGGTLLTEGSFQQGTTTLSIEPTSVTTLVLWVTEMPTASDGRFKLTVSEITVR